MNKLDYPNVIKLDNVLEDESSIILALEYLSGGSLRQYLRKKSNREISEVEAKMYLGQIISAVK